MKCFVCGKEFESLAGSSHCSWKCYVEDAKKANGPVFTPNDLPIACVRHDGALMEHEHADHPSYLMPIEVEYTGKVPIDVPDWDDSFMPQTHAVIYTDGSVVVTLHECTYAIWHLKDGEWLGGKYNDKDWRMTQASIKTLCAKIGLAQ